MDIKKNQATAVDKELLEFFELDKWSNAACRGYAIKACEAAGLDRESIIKVMRAFRLVFEEYPVKEAEQIYYDF